MKVQQEDRSYLRGHFVVNTSYKVMNSSSVESKFVMNAEV